MLQPKRTKFRKQMKGRNRGLANRGSKVSFGEFGLKAVGRCRLTARQIEAARRAMTRHVKRGGKIWIRVFPDKPITQKPLEVRQGLQVGGSKTACSNRICDSDGTVMKAADLRQKGADELNKELIELTREKFNLRMQSGTGQLANSHKVKEVRRDIARVKTILNEKAGNE